MKARLPKGYGGGGAGNMQQMIRQAQKIQEEMTRRSEELALEETTVTSGGGAVEVVITGKKEIKTLNIKPEVVDPEDIEMLQDLIMAAVNEAIRKVEDKANAEMDKISGGLNVPGLM